MCTYLQGRFERTDGSSMKERNREFVSGRWSWVRVANGKKKVCLLFIFHSSCAPQQKVSGTLLVTPNAIMFDPDVLDENVVQKGSDKFGVVVYMDTIMSAALYHDLSAMRYHTRSK